MKKTQYDFGGWATKNDLLCADGRTIRRNAFKDDDGRTVPLVYQHNHEDPTRVIGHALLENKDDGVYAYCSLNGTSIAQHVKECVRHGDINGLSIFANKLVQRGGDVIHGVIRELSVVLSGANPGAVIEFPMLAHGEESETEAFIWCGEEGIDIDDSLRHAEFESKKKSAKDEDEDEEDEDMEEDEEDVDEDEDDEDEEEVDEKPAPKGKRPIPEFIKQKRKELAEKQNKKKPVPTEDEDEDKEELSHAEEDDDDDDVDDGTTIQDVLDTLNDKQKKAVDYVLDSILGGEDLNKGGSGKKAGDISEETVSDVLKTLNKTQKKVFEYLIDQADQTAAAAEADDGEDSAEDSGEEASHADFEGEELTMKKNVFDIETMDEQNNTLTHAQMETLIKDAKRLGSLRQSVLEHSAEYGIDQIDWLFPEDRSLQNTPAFIQRDMGWVSKVMGAVNHTPFSRIKTLFADITEDEARARGYIKGKQKKNEVFTLLKRTTDPQTIYKKQKLNRDDVVDITDFDVVAWMKQEMRMMLDEEIARAILIGDGRETDNDDHISEDHIHSVFHDDETLFVVRRQYTAVQGEEKAKTLIKLVRKAWKDYKGSGNAVAYVSEDTLSDLLLLEDSFGHFLYPTKDVAASVLGVQDIVTVPPMADTASVRVDEDAKKTYRPLMIIVNMKDYNVGADKGGSVNMFEDFDIDYNAQKYLIETRCSGALVRPFSAIVIEEEVVANAGEGNDGN